MTISWDRYLKNRTTLPKTPTKLQKEACVKHETKEFMRELVGEKEEEITGTVDLHSGIVTIIFPSRGMGYYNNIAVHFIKIRGNNDEES